MNHLDILLPYALVPSAMAKDVLRACEAPALATLLARGKASIAPRAYSPFARTLAHEYWLSQQFGVIPAHLAEPDNSPAVAAHLLAHLQQPQTQGYWFVLHPANMQVGMSQLSLNDITQLDLIDDESRGLFEAARPFVEELGHTLHYGNAATWFIRADDWADFTTSTPGSAYGRNVDIWMPEGREDRAWRKLHNEIQMLWHTSAVNEAREARGVQAINALWLWGGAPASYTAISPPYALTANVHGWLAALSGTALTAQHADDILPATAATGLVLHDQLIVPALAEEWGMWLHTMADYETRWFAPCLQALRSGQLKSVTLILTGPENLAAYTVTRASLYKFWAAPALARLSA